MIAMHVPELVATLAAAVAKLAAWLLLGGAALTGLALLWRRFQNRRLQHSRVRIGHFIGDTLSQAGTWGGVQFLWLPAARREVILQNIESDADSPEAMLRMLTMEEGSLAGLAHLMALSKQDATDWVQQTLCELGTKQVPVDYARSRRQLCALVFVGSLPPVEMRSMAVLTDYLRDCTTVGLVSCTPMQVVGVSPVERVASAGLLAVGLLCTLVPAVLSLGGRSRAGCDATATAPDGALKSAGAASSGGNLPGIGAHPETEPLGTGRPFNELATAPPDPGKKPDPGPAKTTGLPTTTYDADPSSFDPRGTKPRPTKSDKPDKSDKSDKPDKSDKSDKSDKPNRHDRPSAAPKKEVPRDPASATTISPRSPSGSPDISPSPAQPNMGGGVPR